MINNHLRKLQKMYLVISFLQFQDFQSNEENIEKFLFLNFFFNIYAYAFAYNFLKYKCKNIKTNFYLSCHFTKTY